MGKESVGKAREVPMEKGIGNRMVDTLDVGSHRQRTLTGRTQVCWSQVSGKGSDVVDERTVKKEWKTGFGLPRSRVALDAAPRSSWLYSD